MEQAVITATVCGKQQINRRRTSGITINGDVLRITSKLFLCQVILTIED
jgi:hypothetical protein